MKRFLFITLLIWVILLLALNASSQTIKRVDKHIYTTAVTDTITGDVFIDVWGKGHPLYLNQKGKLFYYTTNKNGKQYKRYPKIIQ